MTIDTERAEVSGWAQNGTFLAEAFARTRRIPRILEERRVSGLAVRIRRRWSAVLLSTGGQFLGDPRCRCLAADCKFGLLCLVFQ